MSVPFSPHNTTDERCHILSSSADPPLRAVPRPGLINSCHTVIAALPQLIYPLLCVQPLFYSTAVPLLSLLIRPRLKSFFFCPKLVLHKADFMFVGKTHIPLLVLKLSCEKSL